MTGEARVSDIGLFESTSVDRSLDCEGVLGKGFESEADLAALTGDPDLELDVDRGDGQNDGGLLNLGVGILYSETLFIALTNSSSSDSEPLQPSKEYRSIVLKFEVRLLTLYESLLVTLGNEPDDILLPLPVDWQDDLRDVDEGVRKSPT